MRRAFIIIHPFDSCHLCERMRRSGLVGLAGQRSDVSDKSDMSDLYTPNVAHILPVESRRARMLSYQCVLHTQKNYPCRDSRRMASRIRSRCPATAESALSSRRTNLCSTTPAFAPSTRWKIIVNGAKAICQIGSVMGAFEYRQAEEIRDVFSRHQVRYLFLGKSGAILLVLCQ